MPANQLPHVRSRRRLHTAAVGRERVRIRGVVADRGYGYSGKFKNVYLLVEATGATVRVTASPSSTLGTTPRGSTVELAARMTGMVDVADGVYWAERPQLLGSWQPAAESHMT
jgi:hypothetical protein